MSANGVEKDDVVLYLAATVLLDRFVGALDDGLGVGVVSLSSVVGSSSSSSDEPDARKLAHFDGCGSEGA